MTSRKRSDGWWSKGAAPQMNESEAPDVDVLIIGSGPAGLATARELKRVGIDSVILEKGNEIASVWARLYDSLILHTGKHLSHLPGKRFGRSDPIFISRADFHQYLVEYSRESGLDIRLDHEVVRASNVGGGWEIETANGEPLRCEILIVASGIVSGPQVPRIPGVESFCGRTLHSAEYRNTGSVYGDRILIVGAGNSAADIATELADDGKAVDVSVRSGANSVPMTLAGIPIQYLAWLLKRLPRSLQERVVALIRSAVERRRGAPSIPRPAHGPLDSIPLIGFHLEDAIASGSVGLRPGIDSVQGNAVHFSDETTGEYDTIVWATGFRPDLGFLAPTVDTDSKGFALRADRVRSAGRHDLFFVGHNYDSTGGLRNIHIDARLVATLVSKALNETEEDPIVQYY